MNLKNSKRISRLSDNEDDEDKFSDDSLEDTSLPPPAPPPVIPPPPSLSAPVTPSKRHSIAWEVNLDDLCATGNGFSTKVNFYTFITPTVSILIFVVPSLETGAKDFISIPASRRVDA